MSRARCIECDSPEDEGHLPMCSVVENERALRAGEGPPAHANFNAASPKFNIGVHVDDFISDPKKSHYARWMLLHFRLPADQLLDFKKFLSDRKLFCTWKRGRWRVTGASRAGDVWLVADFKRDHGYNHRVAVNECSEWNDAP